jgi:hypothetical protein
VKERDKTPEKQVKIGKNTKKQTESGKKKYRKK